MKKESIFLGSGDVRIPTNHSEKSKRVCDNPVAVVLEYERLVQNILHILIGIQQEQTVKKTTNCRKSTMEGNHKGVFGHVLAMNGVHETQQTFMWFCGEVSTLAFLKVLHNTKTSAM